jgi:hypothetical protein
MWALSSQAVVNTRRFAYLAVAATAIACAQKAPPAEAPGSAQPTVAPTEAVTSTTDLTDLESKLAAAERDLNAQLAAPKARDTVGSVSAEGSGEEKPLDKPEPAGAPTPALPPKASEARKPPARGAGASAQSESSAPSCDTICKALASMERSADRICELTSAEDARCTRARERVQSATKRVELSGCACPQ